MVNEASWMIWMIAHNHEEVTIASAFRSLADGLSPFSFICLFNHKYSEKNVFIWSVSL